MIETSTVARINLVRANEQLVVSEAALNGQRFISWIRLFVFALQGLSQIFLRQLSDTPLPFDGMRTLAIVLYGVWIVGVIVALRRARVDIRSAQRGPLLFMAVDFGFLGFMAWRTAESSSAVSIQTAEMGVAAYALLIGYAVASYNRWQAFAATALAVSVYTLTTVAFRNFNLGIYSFVVGSLVSLGLLITLTGHYVRRMFVDLRKRDNLTRFLPHQVAERILKDGALALQPTHREVTLVFTDLRDFTSFSERLPPRVVLTVLDELFGHLAQIVKGHDGMVNKFMGDGMLAVWGAPEDDPRQAEHALAAALDIQRKVAELNVERAVSGAPELRIGIGVHTGVVAAGMLGGAELHEYAVIGDAVNLAARIEGLTKEVGVPILVSDATWQKTNGVFAGQALLGRRVKGREQPVDVWALEGRVTK